MKCLVLVCSANFCHRNHICLRSPVSSVHINHFCQPLHFFGQRSAVLPKYQPLMSQKWALYTHLYNVVYKICVSLSLSSPHFISSLRLMQSYASNRYFQETHRIPLAQLPKDNTRVLSWKPALALFLFFPVTILPSHFLTFSYYNRTTLIRPYSESHWCCCIRGMVVREGLDFFPGCTCTSEHTYMVYIRQCITVSSTL